MSIGGNGGRWRTIRSFSRQLRTMGNGSFDQAGGVNRPTDRGPSTTRGGSIDQAPMNAKGGRSSSIGAYRCEEGCGRWGSIDQVTEGSPLTWLVGWVSVGRVVSGMEQWHEWTDPDCRQRRLVIQITE
jgi:hypothetical protein